MADVSSTVNKVADEVFRIVYGYSASVPHGLHVHRDRPVEVPNHIYARYVHNVM